MARFPKTIGDVLAAHASNSREIGTSTFGVPSMMPIGLEHLSEELQTNIDVVNADMVTVKDTLVEIDEAQADAVSDLVELSENLTQLDADLVALNAAQVALRADLTANDEALAANDEFLTELDAELAANKNLVDSQMLALQGDLSGLNDELATIPTTIQNAIDEANAIPLTDERFQESSLTIWPFVNNLIPKGAFDVGAVTGPDLEDFSIHVKKFNDNRHRLY